MRGGQVGLFLDLFRFNDLVQPGCTLVRGINDVHTARVKTGDDQKLTRFALVAMTRTTGIPSKVVKFITNVGHHGAGNDLRIGGRIRIDIPVSKLSGSCMPVPTYKAIVYRTFSGPAFIAS